MTDLKLDLYPENKAVKTWHPNPGIACSVVWNDISSTYPGWWCGYVRFHDGLIYDPKEAEHAVHCHGGITYHEVDEGGQVFGFDCMHAWDHGAETPIEDVIRWTEELALNLLEFAKKERESNQLPEGRLR